MRLYIQGRTNTAVFEDLLALPGVEDGLCVDLRSASDIEHLVSRILAWADGELDVLVYAAGANPTADPTVDLSVQDWDDTLSVNLRAPFLVLKHLLPSLAASGDGRVVLISSIFGFQAPANRVAYSASKHGLTALVQTVAREMGDKVHINALAPGPAWGGNVRKIFADHAREQNITIEEYVRIRTEKIPMRRFMEPNELARATLMLCSSFSSYINGEVIRITGGAAE